MQDKQLALKTHKKYKLFYRRILLDNCSEHDKINIQKICSINHIFHKSTLLTKENAMNHPFFYLSIAAIAPLYCIFFLSLIRDVIRSHYVDDSGETPKKPTHPTKKYKPTITSIVLAHWITGKDNPVSQPSRFENPLTKMKWSPSLSVN